MGWWPSWRANVQLRLPERAFALTRTLERAAAAGAHGTRRVSRPELTTRFSLFQFLAAACSFDRVHKNGLRPRALRRARRRQLPLRDLPPVRQGRGDGLLARPRVLRGLPRDVAAARHDVPDVLRRHLARAADAVPAAAEPGEGLSRALRPPRRERQVRLGGEGREPRPAPRDVRLRRGGVRLRRLRPRVLAAAARGAQGDVRLQAARVRALRPRDAAGHDGGPPRRGLPRADRRLRPCLLRRRRAVDARPTTLCARALARATTTPRLPSTAPSDLATLLSSTLCPWAAPRTNHM